MTWTLILLLVSGSSFQTVPVAGFTSSDACNETGQLATTGRVAKMGDVKVASFICVRVR